MSKYILKYEGKEIELEDGIYILGRSKECDIRFQNESVSRKHAKLAIMKDKIFLEDLGSSNGSFINGKLIRGETIVKPEDRLHFGKVVVIIKNVQEETGEMMKCPNCKTQVPANMSYCLQCGAALKEGITSAVGVGDSTAEMDVKQEKAVAEDSDTHEAKEEELQLPEEKKEKKIIKELSLTQQPKANLRTSSITPQPNVKKPDDIISSPEILKKGYEVKTSAAEQIYVEQRVVMKPLKNKAAGFWLRLTAYLIDVIILLIANFIICAILIGPYLLIKGKDIFLNGEIISSITFWILLALAIIVIFAFSIYYVLSGPAKKGGTIGKRLLHLRIYTIEGKSPIGWQVAFIRLLGYILSGLILYIGFLMIAFRSDKRGLHDLIAKTVVVKDQK